MRGSSGRPESGCTASTFGMRESTSKASVIGTGVVVTVSAQNTASASEGASTGEAGRLPTSIGPSRKK